MLLLAPASTGRLTGSHAELASASRPAATSLNHGWWLGPEGINALPLYERTRGRDVVVAIVDSGVRFGIPALAGREWTGREIPDNDVDDDRNGIVDDTVGVDAIGGRGSQVYGGGHGTLVAGLVSSTLAAAPGVAPESKIVPVSIVRGGETVDMADAVRALLLLARRPEVKVINLSWGGYGFDCTGYLDQFAAAVATLAAQQKLVVAAAGNLPRDLDHDPFCPAVAAAREGVVVTASNPDSTLAPWAGRGVTTVNAMAPGNFVRATADDGGVYEVVGTSFATPLVTGVAALLFSLYPHASAAEVRAAILAGERTPAANTELFGDEIVAAKLVGGGIVDAAKSAQLLAEDTSHVPTAFEQLSPGTVRAAKGGRVTVSWTPSYDSRLMGYSVLLRCTTCTRKVKPRWVRVPPALDSVRLTIAAAGAYEIGVTAFDADGHSVRAS